VYLEESMYSYKVHIDVFFVYYRLQVCYYHCHNAGLLVMNVSICERILLKELLVMLTHMLKLVAWLKNV